jgi:hypothetical protein
MAELEKVPGLVADMTVTAARLDRLGKGRSGGKSAETPLSIRLDLAGNPGRGAIVLGALQNTLTTYARLLCERHGVGINRTLVVERVIEARQARRADPAAFALSTPTDAEIAAVWLAGRRQWIRMLPDPVEAHDTITDAIAAACMYVDRLPPLAYRGPCAECGSTLEAEQDAAWVQCGKCGSMYDSYDLRDGLLEQVKERHAHKHDLLSVVSSLAGVDIPDGTFRSWISRERLRPVEWWHDGKFWGFWIHRDATPYYRIGDALDLVNKGIE